MDLGAIDKFSNLTNLKGEQPPLLVFYLIVMLRYSFPGLLPSRIYPMISTVQPTTISVIIVHNLFDCCNYTNGVNNYPHRIHHMYGPVIT